MIEAYPLQWPLNKPRTKPDKRKSASFKTKSASGVFRKLTLTEAADRIKAELALYTRVGKPFRVPPDSVVVSTNIQLTRTGAFYRAIGFPADTGVAVYFTLDHVNYCLPCDKWDTVADNLAAVASHIAAMRGMERWGVGSTQENFMGYKALPEQTSGFAWWDVLGVDNNADEAAIKQAYFVKAKKLHPDFGGTVQEFGTLNIAYKQALSQFKK